MSQKLIHEIPCDLKSSKVCSAFKRVLNRIKRNFPKDYERIKSRLRKFTPLKESEMVDGTQGHWVSVPVGEATWYTNRKFFGDPDNDPGEIRFPDFYSKNLIANIAHELGHVCVREEDRKRRLKTITKNSEWAEEMSADYYALTWGYRKEIELSRKGRDFGHHGPLPGTIVDGYLVTKNMFFRKLNGRRADQ